MQSSYEGVKLANRCEIVTVSRRAARGGKTEVTELGRELVKVVPMCSVAYTL